MSVSFLIKIPSLHNECCGSGGGKKRKGRIKNEGERMARKRSGSV